MTDPLQNPPTATVVPAADVVAPPKEVGPIVHQSFPVRQPREDANEIMVPVRGRLLRRIRGKLSKLAETSFPWPEALLGIATLSFGGTLGAMASSLPWAVVSGAAAAPTALSIVFYVALPVVGFAAGVGFIMLRHFSSHKASEIASAILEDLPDPDSTE